MKRRDKFGSAICACCGRRINRMKAGIFRRHVYKLGGDGVLCRGSWWHPHLVRAREKQVK